MGPGVPQHAEGLGRDHSAAMPGHLGGKRDLQSRVQPADHLRQQCARLAYGLARVRVRAGEQEPRQPRVLPHHRGQRYGESEERCLPDSNQYS